ncbi:Transcription factor SRM1 [Cardamine amara subsp. amara]|uniref:Transcription factor SRM1 n=1 Tax=Cardamine amara subsp. amara TaxID=228776 RepID=A0ABD1BKP2_CARAN
MTLGQENSIRSSWSRADDLAFERALAIYTDKTDYNWEKIAAAVPGKTIEQIKEHYEVLVRDVMMIESGYVPLPDYDVSEEPNHSTSDKERSIGERTSNKQKREFKQKWRKGVSWTSDEHREFLLGLEQYGKGDWRSISRYSVLTRTPSQVASHAQKYYARHNTKNKHSKRSSIHDITDANSRGISTNQRPITWQNKNNNVVVTSNTQTSSQPSLDLPVYGTSNIRNTQATQTSLQPSLENPTYGASTKWNTQVVSQPTVNTPKYGKPIIRQSMGGPMFSPFGTGMNQWAPPPHKTYGVQHHSPSYSSVSSASFNMSYVPSASLNIGSVRAPSASFKMGSTPNASLSMGSVPSASFNMRSAPSSSLKMGSTSSSSLNMVSVPSDSFNMNSILSASLNMGSDPSASLHMGSTPSASLNMGSVPNTSLNMGSVPSASLNIGSITSASLNMGLIPNTSFNMGSVPSDSLKMGSVPSASLNMGSFPCASFNMG